MKPANIKIGPDGKPKILDFGLAKAFLGEGETSTEPSQSPTLTKDTALGAILGTASYMSPEQARGHTIDKRTDIWAFGCCLYEALTGNKAFDGETVSDIISAVIRAEPDWIALPEATPSSVRRLLRRVLTKDRSRRLPHMGSARLELDDAGDETPVEAQAKPSRRRWVPLALVASPLLVALGGFVVWALMRRPAPRVIRLTISPKGEPIEFGPFQPEIALSPDGTGVVYPGDGLNFLLRSVLNSLVLYRNVRESRASERVEPCSVCADSSGRDVRRPS